MRNSELGCTAVAFVWLAGLAFSVAFWGGLIYVIIHFARKFW